MNTLTRLALGLMGQLKPRLPVGTRRAVGFLDELESRLKRGRADAAGQPTD